MTTADQLLEAGALVPQKTRLKKTSVVDDISARVYHHAALGMHPVVKLSADNIADGDDLTMEFLGFDSPAVIGPLAKRQRKALGFPEWALIHDPGHARYALALVKEFRRETRRARSRPGHAYEGLVRISRDLGKSVAHFLPSFWEQVGRDYISAGNVTYASRAFGKAREAEKVHGLKVDEQQRRDAFLEFALAGCVSNKVLTAYGRELLSTHKPKDAWRFFRELCIRRTLGGMPPWTSMIKDLESLIRSAELDPSTELESVFCEVIDSAAMARAPMGFWKGASGFITELVKKNDHVAGVLLNLVPKTSSWNCDAMWSWLEFLKSWGILDSAWKEDVPAAAAPHGGPTAWFARIHGAVFQTRQPLFDIIEAMAVRLKKDKTPLDLYRRERWGDDCEASADLLDMALSLRIPVADPDPEKDLDLNLHEWASTREDDADARERPRDLACLAADKRFSKHLRIAVHGIAGEPEFEAVAGGMAGLTAARQEWLLEMLRAVPDAGLPKAETVLDTIQNKTTSGTFQEFPEAFDELKNIDLLPVVTRTIQCGVFDEYGWPAFEKVYADYCTKSRKPLVFGHFPYLIVSDGLNATVVRGDEVVLNAELKLPKGHKLERLMYLDGDLAIWAEKDYSTTAFWHSNPRVKDTGWSWNPGIQGLSFDLKQGGTFLGATTVHAGQKSLMSLRAADDLYHDGEHFWTRDWSPEGDGLEFREVDPTTGKSGRRSMPHWFEEYLQPRTKLIDEAVSIAMFGDLVNASPLGHNNGMTGFRGRRHQNGTADFEGIDGRSLTTVNRELECHGLLNQPGTKSLLPIDGDFSLWDPSGSFQIATQLDSSKGYNSGQPVCLPANYLHFMKIRDEAASKILRGVTKQQIAVLLKAEQSDFDAYKGKGSPSEFSHYAKLDAVIKKLLPKSKALPLHHGLRGVVVRAGVRTRQLKKLIRQRDPSKSGNTTGGTRGDAVAKQALEKLGVSFWPVTGKSLYASFVEAAAWFSGENDDPDVFKAYVEPLGEVLGNLPVRLWRALARDPGQTEWLTFFEVWSELPFIEMPGRFRCYGVEAIRDNPLMQLGTDDEDFDEDEDGAPEYATAYQQKDNRFLVHRTWGRYFRVLQYAPAGRFESIRGVELDTDADAVESTSLWTTQQLKRFISMAITQPLRIPDVEFMTELSESTGLTVAELVYVWFGLPGKDCWDRNQAIPKPIREAYKLKVKDCVAAKQAIETLPDEVQEALSNAVLSGDPEDLWAEVPGAVAERIITVWRKQKPDRLNLPDAVTNEITGMLGYGLDQTTFMVALNNPAASPLFSPDTKWKIQCDEDGEFVLQHDGEDVFNADVLSAAAGSIAVLSYRLPSGDEARENIGPLLNATLKALKNPALIFDVAHLYRTDSEESLSQLITSVVARPKKVRGDASAVMQIADDGILLAAQEAGFVRLAFRPAKLKSKKQFEHLRTQLAAFFDSPETAEEAVEGLRALEIVRLPEFQRIGDGIPKSRQSTGTYEANPQHSAPKVVATVATGKKVSDDAATYFLQLLALPDPTDRNLKLWNGWTPTIIKKLGRELVSKELVLEAKRPRAGRSFFLPGGWEALKAPHLPIESWKLPMFQMRRDSYQRATPPLARILPLEPIRELFAKAWKRIEDGDVPKYEEVK